MLRFLWHRKNIIRSMQPQRNTITRRNLSVSGIRKPTAPSRGSFSGLRLAVFITMGILVFSLLFLAGFSLYRHVTTSAFFNVKTIQINGLVHLSDADILHGTGLHTGINSFDINIEDIEKKIRLNPWVRSVSIKRILPDSFRIQIQENVAEFWIRKKEKLYYADIEGNAISPVDMGHFMSLPFLEVKNDTTVHQEALETLLRDFKKIPWPGGLATISKIVLTRDSGIGIILGDDALTVFMQPENIPAGMAKLEAIVRDLIDRDELGGTDQIWISDGASRVVRKSMDKV